MKFWNRIFGCHHPQSQRMAGIFKGPISEQIPDALMAYQRCMACGGRVEVPWPDLDRPMASRIEGIADRRILDRDTINLFLKLPSGEELQAALDMEAQAAPNFYPGRWPA